MDGGRNSDISFMLTIRIIPAGFSVRLGWKWNLKLSHFLALIPQKEKILMKNFTGLQRPSKRIKLLMSANRNRLDQ